MEFKELISKLQYFSVDNQTEKTIDEIRQECRDYIGNNGFACCDDNCEPDIYVSDWVTDMHPELDDNKLDWSVVTYQPIQFMCKEDYSDDLCFGEVNISFYGDYDSGIGIFNVY